MRFTRRQFVRGGVTAFTFGFAAPQFLTELALAQGGGSRNLVVFYLGGGNDALSTLVPYADADYYARRPTIAVPAGSVLLTGTGVVPPDDVALAPGYRIEVEVEGIGEVAGIAEKLKPITNPNMKSDLITAVALARAAIEGALANVEINLESLKDAAFAP